MQVAQSKVVLNPHLQIKPERDGGAIAAVTVRAPVKGHGLRVTRITRAGDAQIFSALLIHSATGTMGTANFSDAERARLSDMGVLLAEEQVSAPVTFACDLDDPPFELVPAWMPRPSRSFERVSDLIANPTLRQLGREGPTQEMRGHVKLPNAFRTDRSWIALDDAVTGTPCMYSYSPELAAEVEVLQPGQPVPDTVTAASRAHLFQAGVIESAAAAEQERARCRQHRAAARSALDEKRYVILQKMLAPLQLAAIRRYYLALIAEGFLPFGDDDWPDRYFSGRDPIGYFYQEQLTRLVSDIAGQKVKASFSFFASYHPGSTLPAHRDREQCEWALSLPLDQSPETERSAWPLYLQPPGADAATPIYSGIGDGTLYYGREVRHHRDALTTANYCSFWFLFYVPESFSGSLD